jgi:hypothetical protein
MESGVLLTDTIGVLEFPNEEGLSGTTFELTIHVWQPYSLVDSGPPLTNDVTGNVVFIMIPGLTGIAC